MPIGITFGKIVPSAIRIPDLIRIRTADKGIDIADDHTPLWKKKSS
jgi:hypothetical protein